MPRSRSKEIYFGLGQPLDKQGHEGGGAQNLHSMKYGSSPRERRKRLPQKMQDEKRRETIREGVPWEGSRDTEVGVLSLRTREGEK